MGSSSGCYAIESLGIFVRWLADKAVGYLGTQVVRLSGSQAVIWLGSYLGLSVVN